MHTRLHSSGSAHRTAVPCAHPAARSGAAHPAGSSDAAPVYSVVESAQSPDGTGACEALASRLGGWASHMQQQTRQQLDSDASAAGSTNMPAAATAEQPAVATWRRQLLQAPGLSGNATANGTAAAAGINGTAAANATQNATAPNVTSAAGPQQQQQQGASSADAAGDAAPPPNASACALPAEVGLCRAAIPRWAYDAAAGACVSFTYGGCGGNANNFASREACEAVCAATAPAPSMPAAGIALTMLPDSRIAAGAGSSQAPAAAPAAPTAASSGGGGGAAVHAFRALALAAAVLVRLL